MSDERLSDKRLARRVLSIPSLFALTTTLTVTFPLAYAGAVVADRTSGGRDQHRRILVFVHLGLITECLGVLATAWLWLRAGFGLRLDSRRSVDRHYRLQQWWADRLVESARHHLGLRIEMDSGPPPGGSIIVLARHCCIADALLPTLLYGHTGDRRLGYVLKSDLQWGPCLDIVGNRLPNVFVNRSIRSPAQRRAISDLAGELGPNPATVLFPEGTFHTPARAVAAQRRLGDKDPQRADRLRSLTNLLPPHPGGVLAALTGAPDADVHVVAHAGFENVATLKDLYRAVPLTEPVVIEIWTIPRHQVPTDPTQQVEWLDDVWTRLDHWVDATRDRRTRSHP